MLIGTCHCGDTHWTFEGPTGAATACNCTLCRRYGTLWIYDFEGERVAVHGPTSRYARRDVSSPFLEVHFCPTCGCVLAWRGLKPKKDGRRRMAVNVRLAPPDEVADIPIVHFDGLDSFDDMPDDGRCVRDMWF